MKTRDYDLNVWCDGEKVYLLAYRLRISNQIQPSGEPYLERHPDPDPYSRLTLDPNVPAEFDAIRYVLDNDEVEDLAEWTDHDFWDTVQNYLTAGEAPSLIREWVTTLPPYLMERA